MRTIKYGRRNWGALHTQPTMVLAPLDRFAVTLRAAASAGPVSIRTDKPKLTAPEAAGTPAPPRRADSAALPVRSSEPALEAMRALERTVTGAASGAASNVVDDLERPPWAELRTVSAATLRSSEPALKEFGRSASDVASKVLTGLERSPLEELDAVAKSDGALAGTAAVDVGADLERAAATASGLPPRGVAIGLVIVSALVAVKVL